ncbi:Ig-like domain-containing protein [Thalassotalea piscium]
MRKLSIITLTLLTSLLGCGESSDSQVVEQNPIIEDPVVIPPSSINAVSLLSDAGKTEKNKIKVAGKTVTSRAIVNDSFSNATGAIVSAIGSASISGNLTLGVKATDPEGIKSIALYLTNTNRIFNLCSGNCAEDSLITITGFNPQLAGEQAGNLRIELLVSDMLDNQTIADAININWQPLEISSVSISRENGTISLNWTGESSIQRFNIYASTDSTLTKNNAVSLENGTQQLAFKGTTTELVDMDEDKAYYILITGINNDGESGMSSPLMVPSNNTPVNLPPTAFSDQYQLSEDQSVTANILDNDSDPEGSAIKIHSVITQPNNGTLELQESGDFTYTPSANFFGEDSFSYIITDELGQQDEALVILTIEAVNDIPLAVNDVYSLSENRNLIVNTPGILANDSDIDGDNLEVVATLISQPESGSVDVNNDGSFVYVANSNFDLSDHFVYQVNDGHGGTHSAIVTIEAGEEIAPPEAKNDYYQTNEDITLIVDSIDNGVLANDSDSNGYEITLDNVLLTEPAHGQLSLSLDGTFTYIPDSNYVGIDQFQYQITNSALKSAQATVTITILDQPDAPNAGDDNYQLTEDETLFVDSANGLLKNDIDPDGSTLMVSTNVLVAPKKGSVYLAADGSFEYIPNANFNGIDQFTYQISNVYNLTSQGQVTLTVIASADAPVAMDDFANTDQDTAITIDVLTNDINIDGGNLVIKSAVANSGSVSIVSNTLVYQPATGFSGVDVVVYSIENSSGLADTATVTIAITNVGNTNNIPNPNEDYYSVNEDNILNANSVLINDNDADNDPLTVQTAPITNVSHGQLVLSTDGTFVYTPQTNFNGTDRFVYSVTDGRGGFAQDTVTIYVNPINDLPIAEDDYVSVTENSTLSNVNVLFNDSDPDNDSLSISTTPVLDVQNGNLTLNSDGSFVYKPTPSFNGSDSFIYQVNDGQGGSALGTVNITIDKLASPKKPNAVNDSYQLIEDQTLSVDVINGLLKNDTDPDGGIISVDINLINDPQNGSVILQSNGAFEYHPSANYNGTDQFTYQVINQNGLTSQAHVSLTITSSPDAPMANNDFANTEKNVSITIDVVANDINIDGDNLTIQSAVADTGSVAIVNNKLFYEPESDFFGVANITYYIENLGGLTDRGTLLVTITNTGTPNNVPNPNEDYYSVNEDNILNANSVLINDNDPDNDPLTVQTTPITNVSHGKLVLSTDGTFVYTPLTNFNGTDSFVYSVTDGRGGFAQDYVTIYVNPINDLPIAEDDYFSVNEDSSLSYVNVLSNDSDPDNDSLSISTTPVLDVQNGNLTLNSDGSFVYKPTPSFNGSDSFIYQVNDGHGGSAQGKVSITVNSTNHAPIAANDSYILDENGNLQGSTVLVNDTDPDDDVLTVSKTPISNVVNGVLNLKSDGSFTYTPKANYNGTDSFIYKVSDPSGATAQATVSITIKNTSVAPKALNDSFIVFSLGGTVKGNVLENDFIPSEAKVKVNKTPIVDVKYGVLKKLESNGKFEYTPRFGLLGTDSFTYEIYDENDPTLGTSQATVTLILVGLVG